MKIMEKENCFNDASGCQSEREASYASMDLYIKKHKEAKPGLSRDLLTNYKRFKEKSEVNTITLVVIKKKRDSVFT
jgi:hypothetical protein